MGQARNRMSRRPPIARSCDEADRPIADYLAARGRTQEPGTPDLRSRMCIPALRLARPLRSPGTAAVMPGRAFGNHQFRSGGYTARSWPVVRVNSSELSKASG
jgi:hypothetical protein